MGRLLGTLQHSVDMSVNVSHQESTAVFVKHPLLQRRGKLSTVLSRRRSIITYLHRPALLNIINVDGTSELFSSFFKPLRYRPSKTFNEHLYFTKTGSTIYTR